MPHSFFIYSRSSASKSIFHFLYYSSVETIFKMKLKTLVTKHTDTLTHIMPL